jgi:ribonuclease III
MGNDSAAAPSLEELRQRLGVDLDLAHLELALTHSSYAYEHGGGPNNERLEFLGDAVLGQSVTWLLYDTYPSLSEGELAKRRATVVSTTALADIARAIDVGHHLRLGRGEEQTGGRDKASLLADALEAIIGAVFAYSGPQASHTCVERLWGERVRNEDTFSADQDPKTALQEWAADNSVGPPVYELSETGPDHEKVFTAKIAMPGFTKNGDPRSVLSEGKGSSKKNAEIEAARRALEFLAEH